MPTYYFKLDQNNELTRKPALNVQFSTPLKADSVPILSTAVTAQCVAFYSEISWLKYSIKPVLAWG